MSQAQKGKSEEKQRSNESNRVSVAQLQNEVKLTDDVREMSAKAPVCDVDDVNCEEVLGVDQLPECDVSVAQLQEEVKLTDDVREMFAMAPICDVDDASCKEVLSVDQLSRCDVREEMKQMLQKDEQYAQLGQNVDMKATQNGDIGSRKGQTHFPIFSSTLLKSNIKKDKLSNNSNRNNISRGTDKSGWLKTPSKIRKLSVEPNTLSYNSEAKLVIYPNNVISESPAKRRKFDSDGQ